MLSPRVHKDTISAIMLGFDTKQIWKIGETNVSNRKRDGSLIEACRNGNIAEIRQLVGHGANMRDNGYYALYYSILYRHLDIVKYLFEEHNNTAYANMDAALRYAVMYGYLDAARCLVGYGADINAAVRYGIDYRQFDIVRYCITSGADIHIALQYSIERRYLEVIQYLVEYNVIIDHALYLSAKEGYLDAVRYLVEHGADIYNNRDALYISTLYGHTAIVQYLVSCGTSTSAFYESS
jgi:ankyrin repeat protein